jgi:hypothetical protein
MIGTRTEAGTAAQAHAQVGLFGPGEKTLLQGSAQDYFGFLSFVSMEATAEDVVSMRLGLLTISSQPASAVLYY